MIAIPHPKWTERPLLIVVAAPSANLTKEDMLNFLQVWCSCSNTKASEPVVLCSYHSCLAACCSFAIVVCKHNNGNEPYWACKQHAAFRTIGTCLVGAWHQLANVI